MTKRFLFSFWLVFNAFFAFGQVDSLPDISLEEVDSLMPHFQEQGQIDSMIQYAELAVKLYEKQVGQDSIYFFRMGDVGMAYLFKGRFKEGLDKYLLPAKKALDSLDLSHHKEYRIICRTIGETYMRLGNFEKGKELAFKSLELSRIVNDSTQDALAANLLGGIYLHLSNYDSASIYFNQAKPILEARLRMDSSFVNIQRYAVTMANIGILYQFGGNLLKAKELLIESLVLLKKVFSSDDFQVGVLTMNIGTLSVEIGAVIDGINFLEQAAAIFKAAKVSSFDHQITNNLGNGYLALGDTYKAIYYLEESCRLSQENYNIEHPVYSTALNNLGATYLKLNEIIKADSVLKKAKTIQESIAKPNAYAYSRILHNLGNLHAMSDKHSIDSALIFLNKSDEIFLKQIQDSTLSGKKNDILGYLMLKKGLYAQADSVLNKAAFQLKSHFGQYHYDYLGVLVKLGHLSRLKGNYQKEDSIFSIITTLTLQKLENIVPYLDDLGIIHFYRTTHNSISYILETALEKENTDKKTIQQLANFYLRYKGYALLENLEKFSKKNTKNIPLREKKEKLKQKYSKLIKDNNLSEITQLKVEIETLTKKIDENVVSNSKPTIDLLSKKLRPGEIAIDVFQYGTNVIIDLEKSPYFYYGAFIYHQDGKIDFIKLCSGDQLENILNTLSKEKSHKGRQFINKPTINKLIKNIVWTPLEKYIPSNTHTIYFSPAGQLNQISLEGLLDNDTSYLAQKYRIRYFSNLSNFITSVEEEKIQSNHLILFGGAKYKQTTEHHQVFSPDTRKGGGNWITLTDGLKEIKNINTIALGEDFTTKLFTRSQSKENYFIEQASNKIKKIIHFSDHSFWLPTSHKKQSSNYLQQIEGSLFENPFLRSGLTFEDANITWREGIGLKDSTDDILTAFEILDFDFRNVPLMVLSACESGSGMFFLNGGVFGLERALQLAGVKYLILSRWEVKAMPTRILMEYFYQNLLQKKLPVHQALRKAKLSMIKEKYSPYDWAGFVLIE